MKIVTSTLQPASLLNDLRLPKILSTRFTARLLMMVVLCLGVGKGWGQTTLYSENFGTTTTLPTGWTSSNTTNGWIGSTGSVSSGYAGASGGSNVLFNNLSAGSGPHTLTYSNSLSTVGYTNITVLWGGEQRHPLMEL